MRISTMLPTQCTGTSRVPAETVRTFARQAESIGLEGLWTLDHLVQPPTYRTSFLDPVVALSHAAAAAPSIDLGTSIVILPLRRTANLASRALTLQHLTDGNVTIGVGAGYVPKEFQAVGVPIEERGPRLTEGVEVLQQLFEGEATFDGRFHSFEEVRIDPVLEDPPRILAGGGSVREDDRRRFPEPILDRILNAGGWIARPTHPETLAKEWDMIADYAEEQGVDPDSIDRVLLQYVHLVEGPEDAALSEQESVFEGLIAPDRGFDYARRRCLTGSIETILELLDEFEAIGFEETIVGPATHESGRLDEQLDLIADHVLASHG